MFEFIETQEPSLFYVIRNLKNQSQLKSAVILTIQTMFQNISLSTFAFDLEKEETNQIQDKKSFFRMQDIIGRLLRFMHYILIFSLHEGSTNSHIYPTANKYDNILAQSVPASSTAGYFDR